MAARIPLYLDFAEGEVKEFAATDVVEIGSMVYTKLIPYTATGSESNPFTVGSIDDKVILAVVRAGIIKRITDGAVSDDETIGITGTDMGSNKGILSVGGDVTLNSGDGLISGEKLEFIYYG